MPEHVGNVHVDEANEVGLLAVLLSYGTWGYIFPSIIIFLVPGIYQYSWIPAI